MTSIYINHADQGDIPAVLRQLADDMDAGHISKALGCVVVFDLVYPIGVSRVVVSYAGKGEAVPSAHLLLHKGMQQIAGAK